MKHIYMENTLALIANLNEKNLDFVQQIITTYDRKELPMNMSEYATHPTTYFVGNIDEEEDEQS